MARQGSRPPPRPIRTLISPLWERGGRWVIWGPRRYLLVSIAAAAMLVLAALAASHAVSRELLWPALVVAAIMLGGRLTAGRPWVIDWRAAALVCGRQRIALRDLRGIGLTTRLSASITKSGTAWRQIWTVGALELGTNPNAAEIVSWSTNETRAFRLGRRLAAVLVVPFYDAAAPAGLTTAWHPDRGITTVRESLAAVGGPLGVSAGGQAARRAVKPAANGLHERLLDDGSTEIRFRLERRAAMWASVLFGAIAAACLVGIARAEAPGPWWLIFVFVSSAWLAALWSVRHHGTTIITVGRAPGVLSWRRRALGAWRHTVDCAAIRQVRVAVRLVPMRRDPPLAREDHVQLLTEGGARLASFVVAPGVGIELAVALERALGLGNAS